MKGREQILSHIEGRKQNILKGFVENQNNIEVSEPEDFEKISNEEGSNVYSREIIKGFLADSTKKGEETLKEAQELVKSLEMKPLKLKDGNVDIFFIEKAGNRGNLVKKQITDKTGKTTTVWVKPGEDVKDEKPDATEGGTEEEASEVTQEEKMAEETSSDDLKNYIETNGEDDPLVEVAKKELEKRGELGDSTNSEEGADSPENEGADTGTELDFNNPESIKNYLNSNEDVKSSVTEMMLDDPTLSASQALKIHSKTSEVSADQQEKINAVREALDQLEGKTGGDGDMGSKAGELTEAYDKVMSEEITMDDFKGMVSGDENPQELHSALMEALKEPAEDGYELEGYERAEQANSMMSDLGFDYEVDPDDFDEEEDDDDFDEDESTEDAGGDDSGMDSKAKELMGAYDKVMSEEISMDDFKNMVSGDEDPKELHSSLMEALKEPADDGYELEAYERAEQANSMLSDLGFDYEVDPDDYDDEEEED